VQKCRSRCLVETSRAPSARSVGGWLPNPTEPDRFRPRAYARALARALG